MSQREEGECCRGACGQPKGTPWPTRTHRGHPSGDPPKPTAPPLSLHPLPPRFLFISPPPSSPIHVREAHAPRAVPGQPFSPASFTPANMRTITHTHTGPIPAPPAPRTVVYTASVCEREREGEAASVEEGAFTQQPRLQGQQGPGFTPATSPSGPSLSHLQNREGWVPGPLRKSYGDQQLNFPSAA